MHTVEMVDEAAALLRKLGVQVRQESLGGSGGLCEIKGKKTFFLDLDLSPADQLEQLLDALAKDPTFAAAPEQYPASHDLAVAIDLRRGPWR